MPSAPLPTNEQLARVAEAIGAGSLRHSHRLDGGLGATMDVLVDGGTRLVLRRYGPVEDEDSVQLALRETRALELAQRANVPAPAPIWLDTDGVFDQQAVVTSFVDGRPELSPSNPFEWAEKLATVLTRIHEIRLDEDDQAMFSGTEPEAVRRIVEHPEVLLEHPLGEALLRRHVGLGRSQDPSDAVFSHADYWPGNVLWKGADLVAVVDWETAISGARSMDVANCAMEIRYLGMDRVAAHFVASYRETSGVALPDLAFWESVALCRPLPDIARWVPAWVALGGREVTDDEARQRYTSVLEAFLDRTA